MLEWRSSSHTIWAKVYNVVGKYVPSVYSELIHCKSENEPYDQKPIQEHYPNFLIQRPIPR